MRCFPHINRPLEDNRYMPNTVVIAALLHLEMEPFIKSFQPLLFFITQFALRPMTTVNNKNKLFDISLIFENPILLLSHTIFDIPSNMSEMFSSVSQSWITRRCKNNLNRPFRKSNTEQNGVSDLGSKIWNSLQSDLKGSKDVNSLKHKINEKFFKYLQNQENSLRVYIIKNSTNCDRTVHH